MNEDKPKTNYAPDEIPVEASAIRLSRSEDGQYMAHWGEHAATVRVLRCFPWTNRDHYFTVRDGDDHEICLIRALDDVSPESAAVVKQALSEAGFVFEVDAVEEVREEFEVRNWRVRTRQGPRTFQTRRDEWPRRTESGGMLVRGVAGDLYYIATEAELDPASKKLLSVYVD